MRIIIESDGTTPEIVLRSSGALTKTTSTSDVPLDVSGATDAGAAPAMGGQDATARVTAPSSTAHFDPATSNSAGAAPAFASEG